MLGLAGKTCQGKNAVAYLVSSSATTENKFYNIVDTSSDLVGSNTPARLLRNNKSSSQEVRNTLRAVVPGLDSSNQFLQPPASSHMDVGFVHVHLDAGRRKNVENLAKNDPTSEFVRQKLRQLVPGLTDYSFWQPVEKVEPFVGVVHVTLANSSSAASSSSATTAGANVIKLCH
jgi:hypothetical protein